MDIKTEISIQDAVEYIRGNVEDGLPWQALAGRAYMSQFHFHRAFHALTGVPVARFIREEKLRRAAKMLVGGNHSVTDIAFALGFNSTDVFTRAFKRAYNETPTGMRERIAWLQTVSLYLKLKGDFSMMDFWEQQFTCASPFTVADKRECLPTVETLIGLACTARRAGVLELEKAVNAEGTPFFLQHAIWMVCGGQDPQMVTDILRGFIFSSHLQGAELLKRILTLEGALAIQRGENPIYIKERLLSLLGEQFYPEASAYLNTEENANGQSRGALTGLLSKAEIETLLEGTNLLEGVFLHLDNRNIQLVLKALSENDFIIAFRGTSRAVQERFVNNLSDRMAAHVAYVCEHDPMPDREEILRAQHGVLSAFHKVCAEG